VECFIIENACKAFSVDVTYGKDKVLYMRYIEPGSSPFASEFPIPSHEIDELFAKKIQNK
jgi:hypothetical protein